MTNRTHETPRHQVGLSHKRWASAGGAGMGERVALLRLSLCCVLLSTGVGTGGQTLNLNGPGDHARYVERLATESRTRKAEAILWAGPRGFPVRHEDDRRICELMALLDGRPLYYATTNVEAAMSTASDMIRNVAPWDLDGDGIAVGVWDSAGVLASHQEFQKPEGGSRVAVRDTLASSGHATHVAGTIAAQGIDPLAQGMAPRANIESYDWNDDAAQMSSRAARLPDEPGKVFVSNHSYGFVSGWEYIGNDAFSGHVGWHWFGDWAGADSREDWFGQYTSIARQWDETAHLHPYYLAFTAAGNDRSDNPEPGQTVYYWQSTWVPMVYSPDTCPPGDGVFKNGYDTISGAAVAKNVMTVGAVDEAVARGVRGLASATMAPFSSWGPTDDGRIKPDIVANGVDVYSTGNGSDHDYETSEGTSMACPSATGSAALLVQQYRRLFPGQAMLASTLRGLIIHTADDLGRPGPDYQYGWGLMNTRAAAELIQKHADEPSGNCLVKGLLDTNHRAETHYFYSDGIEPIRVTLCWTAPSPGVAWPGYDLDARMIAPDGSTTYYPYTLSPSNPTAVASTGRNYRDNVEQIYLGTAPEPGLFRVQIGFTGDIGLAEQHYSLISNSPLYGQGPPSAQSTELYAALNTPTTVALEATDDGLPDPPGRLTYAIASLPSHGTLEYPDGTQITEPTALGGGTSQVVYVPDSDFTGDDRFTFFVDDGGQAPFGGPSNVATVTIAVRTILTREYQVSASEDDVSEFGGYLGRYLWVGQNSSAVRFRNVDIPAGSEIVRAHLKMARDSWKVEERIDATVYAEATGHAADFAGINRRIADLPRTEAGVPWTWEAGNYPYTTHNSSPDISSVIQEIVDRPDWSQGNALAILYIGNNIGGTEIYFYSWDRDPQRAAKLEVTFALDPGTGPGPVAPPEPAERAPMAKNQGAWVRPNQSVIITLNAADDGLPDPPGVLSYTIASLPRHGTLKYTGGAPITQPSSLTNFAAQVVYRPELNFSGRDSFTFYADDGGTGPSGGVSNRAVVTIMVRETPPVSPMGYWSFDEGHGKTAYDSAGGRHGTVHDARWTTGQAGGALRFDGAIDHVALPDNDPVWLPQDDFTIAFWVYFSTGSAASPAAQSEVILDFNYGASSIPSNELGYCVQRRADSREILFQMTTMENSDEDLYTRTPLPQGRWYHIAAVRNGTAQEIYIDGALDNSRECSASSIDFEGGYDDDRVNVARYTSTAGSPRYYLRGKLDEIMIFDQALSAQEIRWIYDIATAEPLGPPTAKDIEITTSINTPTTVTLTATDDGLPNPPGRLAYTIASLPSHGALHYADGVPITEPTTLPNYSNDVVYCPDPQFMGEDTFAFYADDGGTAPAGGASNMAMVTITVVAQSVGRTVTRVFHVLTRKDDASGSQADESALSPTLSFGPEGSGMRFRNIDIPNGSVIVGARLRLCMGAAQIEQRVDGWVDAEATGDALDFAAGNPLIRERQRTDASVPWTWQAGLVERERWYSSPDIAEVIQEVVNREDWWSGHSLVLFCSGDNADLQFHACAYMYSDLAAQLQITYVPNPNPDVAPPEPVGEPPTAQDVEVEAPFNTPVTITLQASDDGLPDPPGALSYAIATLPSHGTLEYPGGAAINQPLTLVDLANQVVYRPGVEFSGPDSFTFYADDGGTSPSGGASNIATVTITVTATPPASPMAYWPFDEGEGKTVYDTAGDRHGRITGAQWTDGQVGGALSFNGQSNYVALPDNDPIWLPQGDFSIAFWVYFEERPAWSDDVIEVVLDLNYGASQNSYNELGYGLYRDVESGTMVFGMITSAKSSEDLYSDMQLANDRWYHIVAVRNGTSQELYVDGELDNDRTCSEAPITFTGAYDDNKVNIGRYTIMMASSSYFYFKGKLDEVMIFDQALSAHDIRRIYDAGAN